MTIRDQILATDDIKYDTVDVEEWGMSVRVKSLSASDTERLERYQEKNKGRPEQDYLGYLASLVIVDDDGQRVFTKPGDAKILGDKSMTALTTVLTAASALNGELKVMGLDEASAAKN